MPGPLHATSSQFINLNTDFGYDALGGVGRLGNHRMEVLTPGTRQTDRIPGPPKSFGRWFSKLLDRLTPSSWRAQGKFRRGLEDFSAQTGRLLGYLHEAGCRPAGSPERREALSKAFRELAQLRQAAAPVTSRGADYEELLKTRVSLNMAILREEQPALAREMRGLQNGFFDEILGSLDPASQQSMIDDLALVRDSLYVDENAMTAHVESHGEAPEESQLQQPETVSTEEPTAPPPYRSRFTPEALKAFFTNAFNFGEHVRKELEERQATLNLLSRDAQNMLTSALKEVNAALDNRLSADTASFSGVQQLVDEKMNSVIRCAMDDVCTFALQHMDSGTVAGADGQDFQRITAAFVRNELNALEQFSPSQKNITSNTNGTSVSNAPALHAIRTARQQIRDLSELYGSLITGIDELKQRDRLYHTCLQLNELTRIQLPGSISSQEFGETCDRLIEELHTSSASSTKERHIRQELAHLETMLQHDDVSEDARSLFNSVKSDVQSSLAATHTIFTPPAAASCEGRLNGLEQSLGLHQAVGHAGALLQQAHLPQADSLISQGLQISRLAMHMKATAWNNAEQREHAVAELRSAIGRFMSNMTLAHMQAVNADVKSAQPPAKNLDRNAAMDGLTLLQKNVDLIIAGLSDEQGGAVARATRNSGLSLLRTGQAAAEQCLLLNSNFIHTGKEVAEQLAVCLESGRDDAAATLLDMLSGSRWNKGKHSEAKSAISAFLDALPAVRESRNQSQLLKFLSNRLSGAFVPHDVYMGFDGKIHMLIDTDRQSLMGSKKVQGTRWITLPSPEEALSGTPTGVNRLDNLLAAGDNRTVFYPHFYELLTNYFSGTRYDFDLPEEGTRP